MPECARGVKQLVARRTPWIRVAGMFDDGAAPLDDVASLYGLGPATPCPNVEWAIRRGTLACAAYHVVRARRRNHVVPTAGDVDRIARRSIARALLAARHAWHKGDGRDAVAPGRAAISATSRPERARSPDEATSECAHARRRRGRERAAETLADIPSVGGMPRKIVKLGRKENKANTSNTLECYNTIWSDAHNAGLRRRCGGVTSGMQHVTQCCQRTIQIERANNLGLHST